jgi:hypothetical protein
VGALPALPAARAASARPARPSRPRERYVSARGVAHGWIYQAHGQVALCSIHGSKRVRSP